MASAMAPQPVCGKEAFDLLNCTIKSPFDRAKCIRFLDALRNCVLEKKVKKFSLAGQRYGAEVPKSEDKL